MVLPGHMVAGATGGGRHTYATRFPFRKEGMALDPCLLEVHMILNTLVCFEQQDTVSGSLTSMKGSHSCSF